MQHEMRRAKRKERWTTFSLDYETRHFAALQSSDRKENKQKERLEVWPKSLLGPVLSCELDTSHLKLHNEYEGSIDIDLVDLKPSGAVVGEDLKIKLQRHSESHGHLPTATFHIEIRLRGLDGTLVRSLLGVLKVSSKADRAFLIQDRFKRQQRTLERFRRGEPREGEASKEDVEKLELVLNQVKGQYGFDVSDEQIWSMFEDSMPLFAQLAQLADPKGVDYRFRLGDYLELYKTSRKQSRIPRGPKIDISRIEDFAEDLFDIFRHYMNLVIGLLRYDRQQYWLEEIPGTAKGYFYLYNEVRMNGKGPLIPSSRHQMEIERLPEDYCISEEEWNQLRSVATDAAALSARAGSFSLGGVFSQAMIAVEEGRLETAVILGMVGFEGALSLLEEHYGKPDARSRYRDRVDWAKERIGGNLPPCRLGNEDVTVWRCVEGVPKKGIRNAGRYYDYEDGLIPVRNAVIHDKKEIMGKDQKRIVGYIVAARVFAQIVEECISAH